MKRIPRLLAISDRHQLTAAARASRADHGSAPFPKRPEFAAWFQLLHASGIDGVQLREKDLSDLELMRLAEFAMQSLPDTVIILNGRADLALAIGCRAVHLPADGVPVAALRQRFGGELLIGCSCHHPDEVHAASEAGADYVTFSPIYPTPSKAQYGPPSGLPGLRQAAAVGLPVLALGGVGGGQIDEVAAAGAAGVAGIRAFQAPLELSQLVAARRRLWPTHEDREVP